MPTRGSPVWICMSCRGVFGWPSMATCSPTWQTSWTTPSARRTTVCSGGCRRTCIVRAGLYTKAVPVAHRSFSHRVSHCCAAQRGLGRWQCSPCRSYCVEQTTAPFHGCKQAFCLELLLSALACMSPPASLLSTMHRDMPCYLLTNLCMKNSCSTQRRE